MGRSNRSKPHFFMEAAAASFHKMMSFVFLLMILLSRPDHASSACFKSIISFGDSMADTGNAIRLETTLEAGALPYGETFFHRPTGRWTDGRLIIDFIAEAVGLPFVQPFLGERSLTRDDGGVNFAVGGCTALPRSFLAEEGVHSPTDVSLYPQLTWFKEEYLPKICTKPSDCKNFLETSLVLVGEMGVNDYNYAFLQGKKVELVQSFIPKVVQQIGSTIHELIELGATTLMVPGTLPFGCSSILLTYFLPTNQTDYNPKTGCLNWLNQVSHHHNHLLQLELQRLRNLHPNVNIIYADYFNAAMQIYRAPQKYGFLAGGLMACCGGGGRYNADSVAPCGTRGSNTCHDPSLHVSWDGLHLTEAANAVIADALLRGSFTTPHLNTSCGSPNSSNFIDI